MKNNLFLFLSYFLPSWWQQTPFLSQITVRFYSFRPQRKRECTSPERPSALERIQKTATPWRESGKLGSRWYSCESEVNISRWVRSGRSPVRNGGIRPEDSLSYFRISTLTRWCSIMYPDFRARRPVIRPDFRTRAVWISGDKSGYIIAGAWLIALPLAAMQGEAVFLSPPAWRPPSYFW